MFKSISAVFLMGLFLINPAFAGSINLTSAAMCERISNNQCVGSSVVFSVAKRRVFCYTLFDGFTKPIIIYHRWYHRGELSTQIRIKLSEPGKAAVSAIQLRETDKGPWQVEVVDITGRVYTVLRFSITD